MPRQHNSSVFSVHSVATGRVIAGHTSRVWRKVPEVTLLFWAIKLLSTAMGESISDYSVTFNPYVAVVLGFIAFLIAMFLQFRTRRYVPWVYWLAVSMVAVFGTMAADVEHIVLGVPYALSALGFAVVLAVVFFVWNKSERDLSIHSITTPRREVFYWLTVLATFAMGTALGDLAAVSLGLGYFAAGILFAVVFLIPALGYWKFRWNGIFAFWFAYIMTRPLGASFADWTGKSTAVGGLGWGDGVVGGVPLFLIIIAVWYLSIKHRQVGRVSARARESINY